MAEDDGSQQVEQQRLHLDGGFPPERDWGSSGRLSGDGDGTAVEGAPSRLGSGTSVGTALSGQLRCQEERE